MKRLLLPLLAALALPTAVNTGDLGIADIENSNFSKKFSYELLENKNSFDWECGSLWVYEIKECTIKFSEGKLMVNDLFGIFPSQVINVDTSCGNTHATIFINYLDSEGKIRHAGFQAPRGKYKDTAIFKKKFYTWLNSDK